MQYRCLSDGFNKRQLVPINKNIYEFVETNNRDWYASIFIYNDKHFEQFKKTQSLAGIKDVKSPRLCWDFDNKDNLEQARKDTLVLCSRLYDKGIEPEAVSIAFSGCKGFSVVVETTDEFTVEQFKAINSNLAKGLETNDTMICDPQRIFRLIGTRHNVSGLYKYPLTFKQLKTLSIEEIKSLAKDINTAPEESINYKMVTIPKEIKEIEVPKIENKTETDELDFRTKPKGFTNCKFAILQGAFPSGQRSNCLMALAATFRAQGYPKEIAYNACKAAIRLQAQRYGVEPFSKDELWVNIISQVYGPTWEGGQYSCKTKDFLKNLCDGLGEHRCKATNEDSVVVTSDEVFGLFQNYAENYEHNILTTGIKSLDDKCKLFIGTSNGLLAPPACGKSSVSFGLLNHNSKKKIHSLFFSYDMFHSMVYLRLIQKHTGLQQEKIFEIFKHNKSERERLKELIKEEYKNVQFCFKSGQTADEIEQTILEAQDRIGEKIKLVIVDYNELVITETSDPTQSSAQVAQRLRQIANDREVCILTLLQPSKLFSNPADEIVTYQGAKGSGAIAQSMSLMLSISRPGFSPRFPEMDKYMCINALKNRNGGLFTIDVGWDGLTGNLPELSEEALYKLKEIREKKKVEKEQNGF